MRTALGIQPHDELLDVGTQQAQRRVSDVGPRTDLDKQGNLLSIGTISGAVARLYERYVETDHQGLSDGANLARALHITRRLT